VNRKCCFNVGERGAAGEMVKWKTGLSCRSLIDLLLLASKLILAWKYKYEWHKLFNVFTTFSSELILCADINLRHSDLFPSQAELKVIAIGHHHIHTVCPTQSHRTFCQTAL
jgi:hypothetical protein